MSLYDIAAGLKPLDLGQTLGRLDAMQANRLQSDALRAQLAQSKAEEDAFRQYGPGAARGDETSLAALAGIGPRGYAIAGPALQQRRQIADAQGFLRGLGIDIPLPGGTAPTAVAQGSPPAAPSAPAATPGQPVAPVAQAPLGLRNNNPLNLRFVGQPGAEQGEGGFARFASVEDGLAAAQRQLGLYASRGVNTLRGAISTWAPPSENNTDAYVTRVAQATGIDPDAPINLADPAVTQRIIPAMAHVELGQPLPGQGQGQAPPGAPPRPTGLPSQITPAVIAAMAGSGIPMLQNMAQVLAPMIRQQEAPDRELVPVVDPATNRPVLVPRAQAAGRQPYVASTDDETYRPMTPGERRAHGVPASASAAIGVRTNKPLISGPGQQNFNMGEREADKLAGTAFETAQASAAAADRRAPVYAMIETALGSFQPGMGAETRIAVGQGLRALGIRTNETSQGEVLRALQRKLELAVTPSGQGAITENERSLIRDQVNVLGSTPEGARLILQAIRQLDDYDRKFAAILTDEARKSGGITALVMADARARAGRELGPPLTQDVASAILSASNNAGGNTGGGNATPAANIPGPGGNGTAEPPPPAAPPTATNPTTGARMQWNGSAWVPMR